MLKEGFEVKDLGTAKKILGWIYSEIERRDFVFVSRRLCQEGNTEISDKQ